MEQEATGKKVLVIIDGNAVIHRAYHALPPLTTKDGVLVNAVYGFLLVFFKVLKEFRPAYVVATFDVHAPTFRHEKYKAYKAKRPPAPDNLYSQIPLVKQILTDFGVSIFEAEGFEADDVIGTISRIAPRQQVVPSLEVIIVSGDLDALQLVNDQIKVFALRKGVKDTVIYDEAAIKEKYPGLAPKQLTDFKALRGDPSDNIPGVTGIGEKTALELINSYGTIDNLYQTLEGNNDKLKPRVKKMLAEQKDQALFSKSLVEICQEVPLDFHLENCAWKPYNKEKVMKALEKLEFYSLIKKLPEAELKENQRLF